MMDMSEEVTAAESMLRGETSNAQDDIEASSANVNKTDEYDFFRAASVGDYSIIDKLRESDDFVNLLSVTTSQGNTCLHLAVMGEHQEFVSNAASYAPQLLHRTNLVSETPLILAAASQQEKLGLLLFDLMTQMTGYHQLVKETVLESDANADTAVHHVLRNGHRELAIRLIESFPEVSQKVNYKGESLMYLAIWRGYPDVLEKLMQIPASEQVAPGGETVLRTAILAGNTDIVLKLLEAEHSHADSWDPEDHLTLIYAIKWQNPHMVRRILALWPSLAYSRTESGLSPFSIAAEEDAVSCAEEIIRSCPIEIAFFYDYNGRSALHIAVDNGHANFVKFILSNPGLRRMVYKADSAGHTALHLAAKQCKPQIIQLLLANQQVNHFSVDNHGFTALDLVYYNTDHQMGEFKWSEVVARLSDAGCPLTAPYNVRAEAKEKFIRGIRKHANEVTRSYRSSTSTVGILITTVTFAAAFTLPGGYIQDSGPNQGLPVFLKNAAFQAFLISDTMAMCASLMAAFICNMYRLSNVDFILHYADYIGYLMWFAYATTAIAFATGLYTVLAPTQLWLSILVCVPCGIIPFLSYYFVEVPARRLSRQFNRVLNINFKEEL